MLKKVMMCPEDHLKYEYRFKQWAEAQESEASEYRNQKGGQKPPNKIRTEQLAMFDIIMLLKWRETRI